jgi:hypothetical protein
MCLEISFRSFGARIAFLVVVAINILLPRSLRRTAVFCYESLPKYFDHVISNSARLTLAHRRFNGF